jgi:hypothetical protein
MDVSHLGLWVAGRSVRSDWTRRNEGSVSSEGS